MTAKHTPGPWIVRQFPTFRRATNQYWVLDSIPDSDGKVIANAVCSIAMTNEDAEANARLIAAAPDLLETLKSNLSYLHLKAQQFAIEYGPDHAINITVNRQIEETRAAIAKATGQQ